MFGARHGWCATASLLAQLVFAAAGRGSESPHTVVVSSNSSDPRLTRALVLIRGELAALGLEVQVRSVEALDAPSAPSATPETTSERLSLDVKEGAVVLRVFAAGAATPRLESVDLDGPDVTAEVIAVRAVEAVRAARLLPSPAAPVVTPKPLLAAPSAARALAPDQPPVTPTIPLLQISLGPTLSQNSQGLPELSAQAAVLVGPRWGFLSLGAEGSLLGSEFERKAGWAQVSRRMLFLQLGARARLRRVWEVRARGGVSYLHYRASGVAQPGYLDQELRHGTGAVSLSLGGAYYFARAFGAYLDVSGLAALDAARVRLADENVVTLDQPSVSVGVGVLLGAF